MSQELAVDPGFLDRQMSLKELVEYKGNLEKSLETSGQTLPDEVFEMAQVASQLLAGKVDLAVQFVRGLEAHIKDCEEQLRALKKKYEISERLMKEAITASGGMRLDGKTYSARLWKNSRASTILDDQTKIPKDFFKVSMSQEFKFEPDLILYWTRAILGRMVEWKTDLTPEELQATDHPNGIFYRLALSKEERAQIEKKFKMEPSKSEIEAVLKQNPEGVPGAHMERGTHLRMEKAKTKEVENV